MRPSTIYSTRQKIRDTLVYCKLSTVNCQLSPFNTPQLSQEMFPGSLHSVCQSISGKILFSGIFLKDTIFLDICVNFMTFDERKKFSLKFSLTFSLTFYRENSKSQSVINSCHHLSSPVNRTGNESLGPPHAKYHEICLCSVWEKFDKTNSSRSILDFSMDSGRKLPSL